MKLGDGERVRESRFENLFLVARFLSIRAANVSKELADLGEYVRPLQNSPLILRKTHPHNFIICFTRIEDGARDGGEFIFFGPADGFGDVVILIHGAVI